MCGANSISTPGRSTAVLAELWKWYTWARGPKNGLLALWNGPETHQNYPKFRVFLTSRYCCTHTEWRCGGTNPIMATIGPIYLHHKVWGFNSFMCGCSGQLKSRRRRCHNGLLSTIQAKDHQNGPYAIFENIDQVTLCTHKGPRTIQRHNIIVVTHSIILYLWTP